MTITAAIEQAKKEVKMFHFGNGYKVTTWNETMKMWDEGMSCTHDFFKARKIRRDEIATRAIVMGMGASTMDAKWFVQNAEGSVREIVSAWVAKHGY